jgi:hypothetical protein
MWVLDLRQTIRELMNTNGFEIGHGNISSFIPQKEKGVPVTRISLKFL